MWVARDEDGELYLFSKIKPERTRTSSGTVEGFWFNGSFGEFLKINSNIFPSLKWEDEPIEVEIIEKGKF